MDFSQVVYQTFQTIGVDATYTPPGGDAVSVKVVPFRGDEIFNFNETTIIADDLASFEIQKSEVDEPEAGATIALNGTTYVVQGDPQLIDHDRLIWRINTYPQ